MITVCDFKAFYSAVIFNIVWSSHLDWKRKKTQPRIQELTIMFMANMILEDVTETQWYIITFVNKQC